IRLSGPKGAWLCRFLAHNSLKLGHLEKSLGVFCRYECPLPTLKISAESPQGSSRNSRSREVFYGHPCPYIRLSGPKGAWLCRFLAHNSLKLGHLKNSLGVFCRYECPLATLKISAESHQGSPRNSRSREVFMGTRAHIFVCR